jgi:type I restriction enzyme S subunit
MSSDWRDVEVGQACDITSSKRIFAHEYVDNGVPFYSSKDVIDKALGTYLDTTVFISEARFIEIANKFGYPITGDLLLSSVGNRAGIPYVIKDEGRFYFKDGNLTWFKDFKGLNSYFLCHWLKSSIGQSALNSIMIGSAQKALTISGLLRML